MNEYVETIDKSIVIIDNLDKSIELSTLAYTPPNKQ